MAYSQSLVVIGGLAHIPILITLVWLFDKRTRKSYDATQAALAAAKAAAKAAEEAKAKAAEEAKAAAAAKAKAEAESLSQVGDSV